MLARTAGALASSAGTVIIGLSCMWFAEFGLFRTTGPIVALGLAVGLMAALSLTPAMLAVLGPRLNWPQTVDVGESRSRRFWDRRARMICRRPGLILAVALAALAVPAVFSARTRVSYDVFQELPPHTRSRVFYDTLRAHYKQGEMAPTLAVIMAAPGTTHNFRTSAGLTALYQVSGALASDVRVAEVRGATRPTGSPELMEQLRPSDELRTARDQLSRGGTTSIRLALSILGRMIQNPAQEAPLSGTLRPVRDLPILLKASLLTTKTGLLVFQQRIQQVPKLLRELAEEIPGAEGEPIRRALPDFDNWFHALDSDIKELCTILVQIRENNRSGPAPAAEADKSEGGTRRADHPRGQAQLADRGQMLAEQINTRIPTMIQALDGLVRDLGSAGTSRLHLNDWILADHPEILVVLDRYISVDGRMTKLEVIHYSRPYSLDAIEAVEPIRDRVAQELSRTPMAGSTVLLTGPNAMLRDIQTVTGKDCTRVMWAVMLSVFAILILLLRRVVTSIYLVGTMYLSYLVTLGLTTLVFQDVLGQPGLDWEVPFFLFVLLVALGEDYNIFLMSRVQEESSRHDMRRAIELSVSSTGAIITSCGVIMAGTFVGFLLSDLSLMVQLGFALPVGILLDTFVIRPIVVPCLALLIDGGIFPWRRNHPDSVPEAEDPDPIQIWGASQS